MNRREVLRSTTAAVTTPMINRDFYLLFGQHAGPYSARTVDLIGKSTVIDMLCGLTQDRDKVTSWRSTKNGMSPLDVNVLKAAGITVLNVAEGWPAESTRRMIAQFNSLIAQYEWLFLRIDTIADIDRVKQLGKIGIMVGAQNSEHFQSVDDIPYFYGLGQRVAGLTYNYRNLIGDGCLERHGGGLSQFGIRVVQKLNEVGMAVDISHCGDATSLDALALTKRPVLITHSNCRALVPGHLRCHSDEVIKKTAMSGGVMGITLLRMLVRAEDPTTIEHVLNHYDHVIKIAGAEHVGIGTDSGIIPRDKPTAPEEQKRNLAQFDPAYRMRDSVWIEGINYPKKVFDLVEGFVRRRYSDQVIAGILGGNFRRALSVVWQA